MSRHPVTILWLISREERPERSKRSQRSEPYRKGRLGVKNSSKQKESTYWDNPKVLLCSEILCMFLAARRLSGLGPYFQGPAGEQGC